VNVRHHTWAGSLPAILISGTKRRLFDRNF
jgi:hypothetical protein